MAKQTGPVFCWVNQCPTSFSGRRWTPWRSSVGFGVVGAGGSGVEVRPVQVQYPLPKRGVLRRRKDLKTKIYGQVQICKFWNSFHKKIEFERIHLPDLAQKLRLINRQRLQKRPPAPCTISVVVSWIVAIDPTGVRFPDGAAIKPSFCSNDSLKVAQDVGLSIALKMKRQRSKLFPWAQFPWGLLFDIFF